MGYLGVVTVGFLLFVIMTKILELCRIVLWRPYVLTKRFHKQGFTGPPYKLLYGSLKEIKKLLEDAAEKVLDVNSDDDITFRVSPHYHKWSSEYGDRVLYWNGLQPRIIITDPDLAKQVLSNKFGFYVKPTIRYAAIKLVGKGLPLVEGSDWVRHRRVVSPAFSMDKLKIMIKKMAECTISTLDECKNQAADEDANIKLEMSVIFRKLSADIIAHTAFGSSYRQGSEAFKALKELQKYSADSVADILIPGRQYLPTPSNLSIWKLDRKVKNTLRSIIESRLRTKPSSDGCYGDDVVGLLLGSTVSKSADPNAKTSPKLSMDEVIEECKTFFFGGHETTSNLLTWATLLLSIHQDWQERLREEVFKECGMEIPDADELAKLKMVNMVLLETLRLYSPVIFMFRKALEDMKLGDLVIPKNACVSIPILKIQRSKEYWGEDANEFNPLRFQNGVARAAKHPNAFIAFSIGPRACIGQTFAMLEAKTVLALILQRFSFSLSPDYRHAPIHYVTLCPQYGLPINVKPLR